MSSRKARVSPRWAAITNGDKPGRPWKSSPNLSQLLPCANYKNSPSLSGKIRDPSSVALNHCQAHVVRQRVAVGEVLHGGKNRQQRARGTRLPRPLQSSQQASGAELLTGSIPALQHAVGVSDQGVTGFDDRMA